MFTLVGNLSFSYSMSPFNLIIIVENCNILNLLISWINNQSNESKINLKYDKFDVKQNKSRQFNMILKTKKYHKVMKLNIWSVISMNLAIHYMIFLLEWISILVVAIFKWCRWGERNGLPIPINLKNSHKNMRLNGKKWPWVLVNTPFLLMLRPLRPSWLLEYRKKFCVLLLM